MVALMGSKSAFQRVVYPAVTLPGPNHYVMIYFRDKKTAITLAEKG